MSPELVVPIVAAAWLGIGLVLALTLGRKGYDGFTWFVLGVVLGPLAVVLAIDSLRHPQGANPRPVAPAPEVHAGVDVLVGFDGSAESRATVDAVVDLLGARLGRLTLATVVPYDGGQEAERSAVAALEDERGALPGLSPGLEVIHGSPATALTTYAAEGGYDLLAVGTRGTGHAHLFGSAASELARSSKVPVLLTGPGGTVA